MGYAVHLDAFHGPLDLLLYLVKKEEVDIFEVPIARLADQFLSYLLTLREIDVELAGEFLVLAATLMEIKARSLIPVDAEEMTEADWVDPRANLVKELLEYRKYKDAATALDDMAGLNAMRFPRIVRDEPAAPGQTVVKAVELWDLVSAFARLMRETQTSQVQSLVVDDTPQHVYEAWVKEQVERAGRLNFREIFTPPHHRSRLIGLFLAVLELIKTHAIGLDQEVPFAEIWLHSFAAPVSQGLPLAA
jgi:segregation and condensation protein A